MGDITASYVLVAEFDDAEPAREAMTALEGHGIDAQAIRLVDEPAAVPTTAGMRRAGLAVTSDVARNYAGGGVVGAVMGAAAVAAIVFAAGVTPRGGAMLLGALGGAIAGFLLGGFWGAAARLPANPDAFETYEADPLADAPLHVEVRLEDEAKAREAVGVLQSCHPRSVLAGHPQVLD